MGDRKRGGQPGEFNSNWKGGRSIASNGYVLIRTGVGHPLADVRGYAYEHRIVAVEKIGRALVVGEEIHHLDGNKANNHPDNITVLSHAQHREAHRRVRTDLRLPDENNESVQCACGCGASFDKYDSSGRPRSCLSGHNKRKSPTMDAVLAALGGDFRCRSEIAGAIGMEVGVVAQALSKLKRSGMVENRRGSWRRIG